MNKTIWKLALVASFCATLSRAGDIIVQPSSEIAPLVQSGDSVAIGDSTYIVISQRDWTELTNRVAKLEMVANGRWQMIHKSAHGREVVHGRQVKTVVTNGTVTVVYADGYEHVQKVQRRGEKRPPSEIVRAKQISEVSTDDALERIRARRRKAISTTNEVSVVIGR